MPEGALITNSIQGMETYSCARCRRLKKKCPKESPICSNCAKAKKECLYLGRAPRRTKRQLAEAKLQGNFVAAKRHTKLSDVMSGDDSSDTNVMNSITPNSLPDPVDASMIGYSNKMVKSPNSTTSPLSQSAGSLEGVSSLISALSSLDDSLASRKSGQSNVLGQRDQTTDSTIGFNIGVPPLLRTTQFQQAPFQQQEPLLQLQPQQTFQSPELPIQSLQQHTSQPQIPTQIQTQLQPVPLQFLPALNYTQEKAEQKSNDTQSVPINDSSILYSVVTSVFKGGSESPWINSDGTFKEIDRSLYDRFIAAYFKHNHRTFPMIDKVTFLNKVSTIRDFTAMDGQFEDRFIFKLNMIMAIGCTTLQRAGMLSSDQENLFEHFAYLAMKKFNAVIALQNIHTIKCLLLLGIYSFFEPKGVSSWTISGLTMRLVIGLGLNRTSPPKKIRTMSVLDLELRHRVFWSAYCFERLVATSLGRISAIDDDEITAPLPRALHTEEEKDLEVTRMTISLRRLSGRIYKKVHSVSVGRKNYSEEQKRDIMTGLRKEIDAIYAKERTKIQQQNANDGDYYPNSSTDMISFHSSDIWLAMRYTQLQIMLYRPSALIPKPSLDSLNILGDFCLKALKFTYTLYKKKMLPLNWITLFRALTICNTILYCLCQWSIDLIEVKREIQQCVEILQHFGEKWVFATKCSDVFQNISNTILDISLSNGQVPNMDKLTTELFGASDEYQEILDENNVDVSWIDKLL